MDTFTFTGKPVPKPRMTRADAWKKRQIILAYWEFKDEIKRQVKERGFEIAEAHRIIFFMEMPKSWSKKKKSKMLYSAHKSRPDLDNMVKAVWDSLLPEDSACFHLVATKRWAEEGRIFIENLPISLEN